ncbi:MAG: tRNA 4-thiouridine(8) synthase ThiI, partial [Candidatus Nealsonbacteria bacterium]
MELVICHYSEIGLKGKNRRFFEEKLIENIKKALPKNSWQKVRRISGRILIELKKEGEKKEREIKETLKNVFGIAYFSFAESCEQNIREIKKKVVEILKDKAFKTFKVETQRSKKDFPLNSQEINQQVGQYLLKNLKSDEVRPRQIKVDLENPDITCFIEIVESYAFLYLEKFRGPGGLPVGVSGKAISLVSGGIDSAVASFFGMRRGIKIVFLYFYTHSSSIEKIKKIVEVLNKYQFKSRLYLVPFLDVQKDIFKKTEPKFCCLLCRRFMFRIAEILAKNEKAEALITGENVGQVASQTLRNIGVIEEITKLPVLRPLIGMDKED